MSTGNDILQLMPEIAAIGYEQLQAYCNEWLQRPIAKQFGVVQLMLTRELVLQRVVAAGVRLGVMLGGKPVAIQNAAAK